MRNWLEARMIACVAAAAWLPLSGCTVVAPSTNVSEQGYFPAAGSTHPTLCCCADAFGGTEPPGLLDSPNGYRPHFALPIAFPVPGFVTQWHARKQIPAAAPYPRFQPLPVRPMFAPTALPDGDAPQTSAPSYGALE